MTEGIKLGDRVRHLVSGFEGIAVCESRWMSGCVWWTISPPMTEAGKLPEDLYCDVQQIALVERDPLNLGDAASTEPAKLHGVGGPTSSNPKAY